MHQEYMARGVISDSAQSRAYKGHLLLLNDHILHVSPCRDPYVSTVPCKCTILSYLPYVTPLLPNQPSPMQPFKGRDIP